MDAIKAWKRLLPPDALQSCEKALAAVDIEIAEEKTVFPPRDHIFAAMEAVSPEKVSVVILGQDPYHEEGQANGLAFSVQNGVRIPPSLRNIYKELHTDIGCAIPVSGDLSHWAEQGVLLINTVLTVEKGKAGSHMNLGWQEFTGSIVDACFRLPQPVVFLLWGRYATAFARPEQGNKLCLCSTHPSPLSASRGAKELPAFLGSKPFSVANRFLTEHGSVPIIWGDC